MSSTPRHEGAVTGQVATTGDSEPPAVTLLYAPADRPALVEKALRGDADIVVVDLEDAVAPAQKQDARRLVERLLGDGPASARGVQVRINALESPWGRADVAMLDALPPEVELRLPKVESGPDVLAVRERLSASRRLHCLLESARGVEHAFEIARTDEDVASLALGEADLRSDLGPAPDLLAWSRLRVVMAARAAGLPAPMQSVWTAVHDLDGLAASCAAGRREGFIGRAAIHPAHLEVIRRSYRPDPDAVTGAEDVLRRLEEARAAGRGSAVTASGAFVDMAMVRGAVSILALDRACRPVP